MLCVNYYIMHIIRDDEMKMCRTEKSPNILYKKNNLETMAPQSGPNCCMMTIFARAQFPILPIPPQQKGKKNDTCCNTLPKCCLSNKTIKQNFKIPCRFSNAA